MDCQRVQSNLDEYRDGLLPEAEQREFRSHLAECRECQGKLARLQGFVDSLQRLPLVPPRAGFAEQALRRAREIHQSNPVRLPAVAKHRISLWLATGVGGALAATVLLWVVAFLPKPVPSGVPAVEFGLNQMQPVQLAFDAPEDFRGLTLTVVVPANFKIANHPGRRSLSWRTDLHKGANVLTLPIVALRSGDGDLVARLSGDHKVKTFRVPLKAVAKSDLVPTVLTEKN